MTTGSAVSANSLRTRGESVARDILSLAAWATGPDHELAAGAREGLQRVCEAVDRVVRPTLAIALPEEAE